MDVSLLLLFESIYIYMYLIYNIWKHPTLFPRSHVPAVLSKRTLRHAPWPCNMPCHSNHGQTDRRSWKFWRVNHPPNDRLGFAGGLAPLRCGLADWGDSHEAMISCIPEDGWCSPASTLIIINQPVLLVAVDYLQSFIRVSSECVFLITVFDHDYGLLTI